MSGSNFVLLILPNRKGRIKAWVIHKLENWCLMRADGISLEVIMQCQQRLAYFCFETSQPGTTIATTLVAEGRCLPFTKTASFPPFMSSPRPPRGQPHGVCRCTERSTNLTRGIPPLSFQRGYRVSPLQVALLPSSPENLRLRY